VINLKDNPNEWAQLGYELEEAREHLVSLEKELMEKNRIDDEDFRIQIFHVITHLNRLYNSRNYTGDVSKEIFDEFSKTPIDFQTVG